MLKKRPGWRLFGLALVVAISAFLIEPERVAPSDWSTHTASSGSLSVMTFNVMLGGKPAHSALDAIAAANPDIICIQELTPALARAFEARFAGTYPHRLFEPRPTSGGIGIASRYRLAGGAILELGFKAVPGAAATVRLPGGTMRVGCVHLIPPVLNLKSGVEFGERFRDNTDIRLGQIGRLLSHLDRTVGPALVLGDMNEWQGQAALSLLAESGFTNACDGTGARCGSSWPGPVMTWPAFIRIDHVFGRGVVFADAATLQAGGSDHYPVVARIVTTGGS